MDQRRIDLANWARHQLLDMLKVFDGEIVLVNLSGDASFRRYFRAQVPDNSFVLVDAPPDREDSAVFVKVSEAFREAGLLTPEILSVDYELGFMLLEDFGDQLYLQSLKQAGNNMTARNALYHRAIDALIVLQKNVAGEQFPAYDRVLLHRELSLFDEWFCEKYLGLKLKREERKIVAECFQFLEDNALTQPQVAVHRDYHSRNLMIPDPQSFSEMNAPAMIDFQDAVCGPYTYDLVSLLRDCYIRWPLDYVKKLALYYKQNAEAQGVINQRSEQQFFREFDLMGLQRHLKVIGIFARLYIRDYKSQYLADIPLVIDYFLDVAEQHQELGPFVGWFRTRVLPEARTKLPGAESCAQ
jgi:N-acetylmuramate 1-kinase